MRKIDRISISAADRERLERLVRGPEHAAEGGLAGADRVAGQRRAEGGGDRGDSGQKSAHHRRWRRRYAAKGVDGLLKSATRVQHVKPLSPDKIKQVVHMTLHEKPPVRPTGACAPWPRWRAYPAAMLPRVWHAHGLKLHLVDTFKVSHDPHFADKVVDVVGHYFDPPDHAMVLCVDEKSQIQALDRTQPGLPLKPGRAEP